MCCLACLTACARPQSPSLQRQRQREAREAERQAWRQAAEQAHGEALQRKQALLEMVQQVQGPRARLRVALSSSAAGVPRSDPTHACLLAV